MIRIKEQVVSGLTSYPKAIRLIWKNKLGRYLALPVVFNIIVVFALIFSGIGIGDWINGIIERHTEDRNGWIQVPKICYHESVPQLCSVLC